MIVGSMYVVMLKFGVLLALCSSLQCFTPSLFGASKQTHSQQSDWKNKHHEKNHQKTSRKSPKNLD